MEVVDSGDNMTYIPLRCSQNTAIEHYDRAVCEFMEQHAGTSTDIDMEFKLPTNDGTNGCTFLTLMIGEEFLSAESKNKQSLVSIAEELIEGFPADVNDIRDKDTSYEPIEALSILQEQRIVKNCVDLTLVVHPRTWIDERRDPLLVNMWESAKPDCQCFIIVAPPYTVLMICNNKEILLIDTHPVSEIFGGNENGLLICVPNSENGREQMAKYVHKRYGRIRMNPLKYRGSISQTTMQIMMTLTKCWMKKMRQRNVRMSKKMMMTTQVTKHHRFGIFVIHLNSQNGTSASQKIQYHMM